MIIKKLIYSRKTVFVRKGGRNFRYSAYSIVSNGKNKIGFAKSRSKTVLDATYKSYKTAKKQMFKFNILNNSFPCSKNFKTSKTVIKMLKTNNNLGIIAGGCVRIILRYTGIKNLICKIYGSKNKYNVFNTVKKMFMFFKCLKKD
ncbi:hypothetical protein [Candidatus Vidania fulgoroideorum]